MRLEALNLKVINSFETLYNYKTRGSTDPVIAPRAKVDIFSKLCYRPGVLMVSVLVSIVEGRWLDPHPVKPEN